MTALEYFRENASEFDNIPDSQIESKILSAVHFIDVSSLDDEKKALATALFTAHLFWLEKYQGNGGGARGVILNERDGEVSKRYGAIKHSQTWLGQSVYGMLYSKLNGGIAKPTLLIRTGVC
jgi:hypothetical protein